MKLAIYGCGGYGREILIEARNLYSDKEFIFVESSPTKGNVCGIEVVSHAEFVKNFNGYKFIMGVSNHKVRKKISLQLVDAGLEPHNHFSSSSIVNSKENIGEGVIFNSMSMITDNVKIGKFCQFNIYSYVAHDCTIGNYVTFAPKVACNGNVIIKDNAYIGTGAVIKQGTAEKPIIIGESSIVGMGAIVTKDVKDGETVIGNPAKPFKG
jgi:sugar O-acyltransferase (sialic acid O-acetyltransferase NeuD family)